MTRSALKERDPDVVLTLDTFLPTLSDAKRKAVEKTAARAQKNAFTWESISPIDFFNLTRATSLDAVAAILGRSIRDVKYRLGVVTIARMLAGQAPNAATGLQGQRRSVERPDLPPSPRVVPTVASAPAARSVANDPEDADAGRRKGKTIVDDRARAVPLHTLPIGTHFKTPDDVEFSIPGRHATLLRVGEGSCSVRPHSDTTRKKFTKRDGDDVEFDSTGGKVEVWARSSPAVVVDYPITELAL